MGKILERIVGFSILALFILSLVPVALADNGSSADVTVDAEGSLGKNKGKGSLKADVKADLESAKDEFKESKEALKEAKEKAKEVRGDTAERRIVSAFVERKEEQQQKEREEYKEAKENYHEHREKLHQLKKEAKCKDGSEQCNAKKDDLKRGVTQHLLKTIELIESSLNRLTERVESSKVLTEDEKEQALEQIATLEAEVTIDRERVEALVETATNEELRLVIKDLKETWREVRKTQKRIIANLISSKLDHLVDKHAEYQNGMEARIAELRTAGVDVSELEHLLDVFKSNLAELEKDQNAVHEKWLEIRARKGSIEAWHETQLQVREDMKESKEILRKFIALYKELKDDVENSSAMVDASVKVDVNNNSAESSSEASSNVSATVS